MRRVIVNVAGPTGVGKTSLADALVELADGLAEKVSEPPHEQISEWLKQSCWADVQERIIAHRAKELTSRKRPFVIVDRGLAEDQAVFLPLHSELGHLSASERNRLDAELTRLQHTLPGPSAMVHLTAPEEVLIERLRAEKQPEWLIDSLQRQVALYALWLSLPTNPAVSVMSLDTVRSNPAVAAREVWSWLEALRYE